MSDIMPPSGKMMDFTIEFADLPKALKIPSVPSFELTELKQSYSQALGLPSDLLRSDCDPSPTFSSWLNQWLESIKNHAIEPTYVKFSGHRVYVSWVDLDSSGAEITLIYHPFVTPWIKRHRYSQLRYKYLQMKGRLRNRKRCKR